MQGGSRGDRDAPIRGPWTVVDPPARPAGRRGLRVILPLIPFGPAHALSP